MIIVPLDQHPRMNTVTNCETGKEAELHW
jgi:hypothetical protein